MRYSSPWNIPEAESPPRNSRNSPSEQTDEVPGRIEREQVDIERESLTEDNESIEQIERHDRPATTRMRGLSLLTPIVGLLLCTPKYLAGTMTLGEVVQGAAAFALVQGAFNWINDSYGGIAEWVSSANRVASLLLALDQIDGSERSISFNGIVGVKDDRRGSQN